MISFFFIMIFYCNQVFGDRLKLLDIDRDGEVTADEVKRAMVQVLKRNADTERSVEDLFQLVDSNKDGKGEHC